MNKTFRTIVQARNALALDCGFDPFFGGRCTRAKLESMGYVVDPRAHEHEHGDEGVCRVCGALAIVEIFCQAHGVGNCGRCDRRSTGLCAEHTSYRHECDCGHTWQMTRAEQGSCGAVCPVCGEPPV